MSGLQKQPRAQHAPSPPPPPRHTASCAIMSPVSTSGLAMSSRQCSVSSTIKRLQLSMATWMPADHESWPGTASDVNTAWDQPTAETEEDGNGHDGRPRHVRCSKSYWSRKAVNCSPASFVPCSESYKSRESSPFVSGCRKKEKGRGRDTRGQQPRRPTKACTPARPVLFLAPPGSKCRRGCCRISARALTALHPLRPPPGHPRQCPGARGARGAPRAWRQTLASAW